MDVILIEFRKYKLDETALMSKNPNSFWKKLADDGTHKALPLVNALHQWISVNDQWMTSLKWTANSYADHSLAS